MSANVVRHDVVQITFDIENPFQDLIDEMNELKKKAGVAVESVEDDFEELTKTVKSVQKEMADINKTKFTSLKSNLTNTLNKINSVVKKVETGFKNLAKVGFEKLKSGLLKIKNHLINIAKKAGGAALTALKKVASVSFKSLAVGIGAAATAVGALVGKSVSAYADYEQLKGGVETLFKGSSKTVETYANNAYKTAGLSANQYMETVTSFSASLLQSLGGDTAKAAKYADMAISDMSDNSNKMGTSMESIQYAYQGFAKQNYTMLDNLKLGYGGTKEEMKRLVKDAAKVDKSVNANSLSYGNIVKAIHAIQVKMDIYGTTSKEASTTITGSINSMKSAWGNLMPALIKGGDQFDQCVKNLIESIVGVEDETGKRVGGVINNLKPAIESAIKGVGTLISELAPIIEKELPTLIQELLPPLIKAATSLVAGLIKSLPSIVQSLVKQIPLILSEVVTAINETFGTNIDLEAVKSGFESVKETIKEVVEKVKSFIGAVIENWPAIKKVIIGVVGAVGGLRLALGAVNTIIKVNEALTKAKTAGDLLMAAKEKILTSAVWSSVKAFGAQAMALMTNPVTWIVVGIVALIAAIILLIKNWDKVKEVALKVWGKIKEVWGKVSEWFSTNIIQPVKTFFTDLWNGIKTGATNLWNGICSVFSTIANWIYTNVIQPVVNFFKGVGKVLFIIVAGIVGIICQLFLKIAGWVNEKVIQPVVSFFVSLWNKIKEIVSTIVETIKSIWGTVSEWVNSNVIQPVVGFFVNLWYRIKAIVQLVVNVIKAVWGAISEWVNSRVIQPVIGFYTSLWQKIKSVVQNVWQNLCSVWGKISGWVNEKVVSPIKNFFGGLWLKIKDIAGNIKNSIVNAFKSAWDKVTSVWGKLKDFFNGIWGGLKDTGKSLKNALLDVWKKAVKAVATPVNKLIGGANWVLEKLGSDTIIAEWKPYAKGTDGHKGGNALVNDGRGAELIQMPNGNTFIPQGRNVLIPNAPVGMKVLPAEQTAKLMGKSTPTFHYEGGIGDWEIWDFFDNAKGLVSKVIDKFVSYDGVVGYALDVGKAMIGKAKGAMTSWIKGLFDEFGIGGDWIFPSTSRAISSRFGYRNDPLGRGTRFHNAIDIPAAHGSPVFASKGGKITRAGWATGYGNLVEINHGGGWVTRYGHNSSLLVSEGQRVKQKQTIALVGSTGNSTGPHIHFEMRKNGVAVNPLNYVQSFANGGIATRPSIFGEAGAEMAIPLTANKRKKGIELWLKAGDILGVYTPEQNPTLSSYSPEGNSVVGGNRTVNNTYNPTFVLNMNGASATETNKRKVKQWVKESITETFDEMGRTNPQVLEV